MKFHTILTVSATALFFSQVLAITPQAPGGEEISASGSDPSLSVDALLMEAKTPETHSVVKNDSIESDLAKSLGWSQKDSAILTSFLTAIDRMSLIIGERAQQELDQATVDMLAEFQIHARQLMADAGYEFRHDPEQGRVLTRTRPHEQDFPDLIEKMVLGLVNLLNKLRESAKKNPVMAVILNLVTDLLRSLGKFLESRLTKPKSAAAASL